MVVIGIGNSDRADDGIGPLVAGRVRGRCDGGIRVLTRSGDALALIEDWARAQAAVLIDAAAPAGQPGRIHRIDLASEELPRNLSLSSTHAMGIAEATGLARELGRLPRRTILFAVEGACFDPGGAMSAEVAAAGDELVGRVISEAHRLRQAPSPARRRPRSPTRTTVADRGPRSARS